MNRDDTVVWVRYMLPGLDDMERMRAAPRRPSVPLPDWKAQQPKYRPPKPRRKGARR